MVMNQSNDIREEETQSFFGFFVPVRQAMWVELLVIQVIFFIPTTITISIVVIRLLCPTPPSSVTLLASWQAFFTSRSVLNP